MKNYEKIINIDEMLRLKELFEDGKNAFTLVFAGCKTCVYDEFPFEWDSTKNFPAFVNGDIANYRNISPYSLDKEENDNNLVIHGAAPKYGKVDIHYLKKHGLVGIIKNIPDYDENEILAIARLISISYGNTSEINVIYKFNKIKKNLEDVSSKFKRFRFHGVPEIEENKLIESSKLEIDYLDVYYKK